MGGHAILVLSCYAVVLCFVHVSTKVGISRLFELSTSPFSCVIFNIYCISMVIAG